jgi:hypothetical protein
MAVSDNTGNRPQRQFWRQTLERFSRYDLLLAVIPLLFAAAPVVSTVTGVPLEVALAGSGLLGCVSLVDAIYRNPPVTSSAR